VTVPLPAWLPWAALAVSLTGNLLGLMLWRRVRKHDREAGR